MPVFKKPWSMIVHKDPGHPIKTSHLDTKRLTANKIEILLGKKDIVALVGLSIVFRLLFLGLLVSLNVLGSINVDGDLLIDNVLRRGNVDLVLS